MQVLNLQQNSEEWFKARKGKITGSKLKGIISKRGPRKIGFYQLIVDRLGIEDNDGFTSTRERGKTLEDEAIEQFEQLSGLKVKQEGMWISDDSENIAISPDGVISKTEAIEIKCLSAANHLKAIIENTIPPEFQEQVFQYFIVNEKLNALHVTFYDPRIAAKPLHIIKVYRKDIEGDIERLKDYQIETLKEVDKWVEELSF